MLSYFSEFNIGEDGARRLLSAFLLFCVMFLSISYFYLVNSSVLNVIAREQDNKEIARLAVAISGLENNYIARRSDLDIDTARSLGFVDDFDKVHFSSEGGSVSGSLSLLGNEN